MRGPLASTQVLRMGAVIALMTAVVMLPRSAQAQPFSVSVIDDGYLPEPITISPGTTVTWKNIGKEAHSVTSDEGTGELFDSGTLSPQGTYNHTFNQEGAFTYHCVFHDDMLGTIIVQRPGQGNGTAAAIKPTSQPVLTHKRNSEHKQSNTVVATAAKSNYRFKPRTLKIRLGVKVTWRNSSSAPHTVTSRTSGWRENKTFGVHGKISFLFKKVGTFSYYCRFHRGMVGKIVVQR